MDMWDFLVSEHLTNGQMIIDWLEKDNLIQLSDDVKCLRQYTWKRQN